MTTLSLVLRGLRSRALLSATTLAMMVLAVAGTVLGPAFQDAVTASYTLTRLDGTSASSTALTYAATPGRRGTLRDLADEAAAQLRGSLPPGYGPPEVFLRGGPVLRPQDGSSYVYATRTDACSLLDVEGRCPERAGEVMINRADLGPHALGDVVPMPGIGPQTVVGTYQQPDDSRQWLLPGRLASRPATDSLAYRPGPAFLSEDVLSSLPRRLWGVDLDSRFTAPRGVDEAGLDRLVEAVEQQSTVEQSLPDGGRVVGATTVNALGAVLTDVRAQRDAARSTMTPAVISLALLALAIILRLQAAAADLRAPELALAALRGVGPRRTWLLGLAEPLVLLATAAPFGVLGGWAATRGLAGAWLRPGTPVVLPAGSWIAAALVVTAIAGVAAYAVGQGRRETLAARVAGVRRPTTSSSSDHDRRGRGGQVVEALLVVLAVVLPLSRLGREEGNDSDLGLGDLLLPVVTAVAAGLLVTRLTTAAAAWWTRHGGDRPLSVFVAARALARRAQGTLVILPVSAAIAVAVFATGVDGVAADWRASVAATTAPADEVWDSPLGPGPTMRLTREADPEGRWVMSASRLYPPDADGMVLVDAERLARVARWSPQWLDGRDAADAATLVRPAAPLITLRGEALTVTGETGETGETGGVTVVLAVDNGSPAVQFIRLGPFPRGSSTLTAITDACRSSCEVRQVRLEGGDADTRITLSGLAVDGTDVEPGLPAAGWTDPATGEPAAVRGDALTVTGDADLEPAVAVQPVPVVVGRDAGTGDGTLDLAGTPVPVTATARAESLPLVGPAGLMVDQATLLTRLDLAPDLFASSVLVRADTPDDVRAALSGAGVVPSTRYADTRRTLDDGAYAQALRLYLVVAVALLLMALGGLLVSAAVQLPSRRRDAAALRVVGVRRRTVVLASLWESVVALGAAAVAGLAAGALAQVVLLRSLTLGLVEDASTPRVLRDVDGTRLLLVAGGVLGVLLLVALLTSASVVRGARGATLREDAR